MKLLIIEDDRTVAQSLIVLLHMRWSDADIQTAANGTNGLEYCLKYNPDLVILDLGLPDMDGLDVLKEIRLNSIVPVIILTARGLGNNIVRGLELGADDYITKPFDNLEFLSRVHSLTRRMQIAGIEKPYSFGNIQLDRSLRTLTINQKIINLTRTEGIIMHALIRNPGRVITINRLSDLIWGSYYPGSDDSIRVYIRRIREKIEIDSSKPTLIITKPGLGYYLSEHEPVVDNQVTD